ncbi:MAG: hypothetical protein AAF267_07590 [Deinococcota bacterium]
MNKTFVRIVTSVLVVLLMVSLSMSPAHGQAQMENVLLAQESNNELELTTVPVQYEITDDLAGTTPNIITTSVDICDVNSNNLYVEIYAFDGELSRDRIGLLDEEGRLLALTYFYPIVDEKIVFSSENTIRKSVMDNSYIRIIADDDLRLEVYNAIENHPRFEEAVALVASLDELPYLPDMPGYDDFFSWSSEISNDLVATYQLKRNRE